MAFDENTVIVVPSLSNRLGPNDLMDCTWFNSREEAENCTPRHGGIPGMIQYPQSKFIANKVDKPFRYFNETAQYVCCFALVYDMNRNLIGEKWTRTYWSLKEIHPYGQDEQKLAPTNNQGLSTCFWCNNPTKKIDSGFSFYDYCPKCKK
jgi:hypothetical protein